ncbi:cobalamin B12-binding domain-containing protein [Candidatus Magnetobacterium casense]|uniref:Cobalamin B12-binding domain-containing protein n=1 Tax=Candidatus Magnetobacterium casense TaxID=1455061 RepID=A0ABS6RVZ2_9BACT|nr:cobalamin-dependent protein [Candidatus Magnetobacterium casensis]MBV6340194.1 cobalamin B12-binding domain-containing protein [Candidatus Magnetobacterium casensis]
MEKHFSKADGYIEDMTRALLSVDKVRAKEALAQTIKIYKPIEIVEYIIVPSLKQIGEAWTIDEVSLSQVYMSGKICNEILEDIIPRDNSIRQRQLTIAIATLEDFHTLGKQIVKGFLHAAGYEIVDYGNGLSVDGLVGLVIRDKIDVLLISVLMLPSALSIKEVRKRLKERQAAVTIVAGGAPFNFDDKLYEYVEADHMGKTVSDAINIIRTIETEKGGRCPYL